MNRITPQQPGPLIFPMWLMMNRDGSPLTGELGARRILIIWSHGDQIGEDVTDKPGECPPEEMVESATFDQASDIIPVIEQEIRDGLTEVIYGLLPESPEPDFSREENRLRALGQEPATDFLARLRERAALDEKSGQN